MTLRDALKVMADGEELRQCRGTHENRCRFNVSGGHFQIKIGGGDWRYATHLDPKAMYERITAEADSPYFELKYGSGTWQQDKYLSPKATYERITAEADSPYGEEDDVPPGFEAWPIDWQDGLARTFVPLVHRPTGGVFCLSWITAQRGFSGWGYRNPATGARTWSGIRTLYYNARLGCLQSDWQEGSELVQPDCVLMQKGDGDGK